MVEIYFQSYDQSLSINIYQIYQNLGIFNLIAPFLLIFSLIYGLLRKSKIFNSVKNSDRIYAVIAFVLSLYYIYAVGLVNFTQNFLSFFFYEMMILFMILMALSLLNTFQASTPSDNAVAERRVRASVLSLLSLTVVFAFLYASLQSNTSFGQGSLSVLNAILYILINSGLIYILILAIIFIGVVYWMTRPVKKPTTNKPTIKDYTDAYRKVMEDLIRRAIEQEQKKEQQAEQKEIKKEEQQHS